MKIVETTTVIAASREAVWETLVDVESYDEWNPFIVSAAGTPAVGERLAIRIQPPGGRTTGFRPRVTAAVPGERLEWLGHLGVRGLFDGRHEFRLEPLSDGRTRLVQREAFSGLLVGLLLDEQSIQSGFRAMNDALKQRVETTGTAVESAIPGVAA